ncbi:hypothetical protein [Nitratireductor pacificus]|uniref:Uncharacterized protein n=1 Tax=Nitratireductor pacificus pht-3B TaxID=391937 RepID=K2N0T2_9HYPH|nr:hypothetical protein [Nitratireductor pacificus]EKF17858.1 hypothetical protein NA2_15359 [Nitratireductor pacificus pht-3B]
MEWLKELARDDFGKTVLTVSGTLFVTAFGVFIGGAKDIALDWWKRRRLVKYQAMLIATTLEQFISDCIDLIYDPTFEDEEGVVHGTVPNPSIVWSPEIDWPSIPSDLMYRCLLLPAQAKSAAESADFIAEQVSGPPDYSEYFEELELRFSDVGLRAFHILKRLIESYGVHWQNGYTVDPQVTFQDTIDRIRASKKRQLEQQNGGEPKYKD